MIYDKIYYKTPKMYNNFLNILLTLNKINNMSIAIIDKL